MTYYISKFKNQRLPVREDVTETKFNAAGKPHHVVHEKALWAHFKAERAAPAGFRERAVSYFNDPNRVGTQWAQPGITGLGESNSGFTASGEEFGGDDPLNNVSILDTSNPTHVEPQNRELVEQYLDNHPLLGVDFIRFETNLQLPWPAYANLKATNAADVQKILTRIDLLEEDGNLDAADYVIKFEKENENRVTIINAVRKHQDEKAAING